MAGIWWEYLLIAVAAAVMCVTMTPLAMQFAVRMDLLDQPGGHKSHSTAVPYLGGVAIVSSFAITVLVASLLWPPQSGRYELSVVLALAILLALVGLVDDLRNVSPLHRVLVEVFAAVTIWFQGAGVDVTSVGFLDLGLTVLWIVGITNAFNLLDNMDGLAAGIASISSFTVFSIAATNGQFLVAALAIGLTGCTVGFLRYNFHPARIYMGDGGSMFIGFLVAYLCIKLKFDGNRYLSSMIPALACSVAIVDTSIVTISRLVSGLSPFKGGQDHVSHRLVCLGMPIRIAVGLIYLVSTFIGILTFLITRVDSGTGWFIVCLSGISLTILGGFLLTVPVGSISSSTPESDTIDDPEVQT